LSPLDAFWHIANFFAPAWAVAALLALVVKLLWRRQLAGTAWTRLTLAGALGGSAGLIGAIWLLGHDGTIAGYGLLLLGVSLPQWWMTLKPGR